MIKILHALQPFGRADLTATPLPPTPHPRSAIGDRLPSVICNLRSAPSCDLRSAIGLRHGRAGTFWGLLKPSGAFWCLLVLLGPLELSGAFWDFWGLLCLLVLLGLSGAFVAFWGIMVPSGAFWCLGAFWGLLVRSGAFWCLPAPSGTFWSLLKLSGAFWAFWRLLGLSEGF